MFHSLLYVPGGNKKHFLKKRYSAAFQLWNLFLGLYVLLFVTQGHPTWEMLQCKQSNSFIIVIVFKPIQGTFFKYETTI